MSLNQGQSISNELRILIYRLGETSYAIDVQHVREVLQRVKTVNIPNKPRGVEEVFNLRDEIIPLVYLSTLFDIPGKETCQGSGAIIIIEYRNVCYGILVDGVDVIKSVDQSQVQPPSDLLKEVKAGITGTVEVDNRTILIPDFDRITGELFATTEPDFAEKAYHKTLTENADYPSELQGGAPSFEEALRRMRDAAEDNRELIQVRK